MSVPASASPADVGQVSRHQPAPPTSAVVAELDLPANASTAPITIDSGSRPSLEVRIGSAGPFRFLVDTGAQATVVGRELANRLNLAPAGRAMLVATGSKQMVDLVQVSGLAFADRELHLPAVPVLESAHLGADGILGLDTLQNLRVLMDFRNKRISLADPREEASARDYEIVVRARKRLGQMIIADALVDGVRTAVVIDTGADISVGNLALQRRLRGRAGEPTMGIDVHGFEYGVTIRMAERVRIGSLEMEGVPLGFYQSPAFAALDLVDRPAMILGMGTLGGLDRLAIDFSAHKVMFDLPRQPHRRGHGTRHSRRF